MSTPHSSLPRWNTEIGGLSGTELFRVSFDRAVTLEFSDFEGRDFELSITGPLSIQRPTGSSQLDPGSWAADLGLLITAMASVVANVWIDQDHAINVELRDWGSITVNPSDEYEAFEIAIPGRVRLISMAGGDFA